jgi:cytochrome c-type biogenesis protein
MAPDALRLSVEHFGLAAVTASILAGLVFSFNPVALACIPVSLAYITKARTPQQAFQYGTMFIIGMFVMHAVLGVAAGIGGAGIKALLGREWGVLLGPLLIFLGVLWAGWIRVPLPRIAFTGFRPDHYIGAFMLGVLFSVAVCPVCTPALVILLGVVASIGSVWIALLLLLAFALGRALPVALGAWSIGHLENLRALFAYRRGFEIIGAVTLIVSGLYMLNAYFLWLPRLGV